MRTQIMRRSLHSSGLLVAGAMFTAFSILTSTADEKADIRAEADFASGLVDLRFPDYAQKVVDRMVAQYGAATKADESRVRIKIMTSTGNFKEAREIVDKMPAGTPETMAMKLTLADQLYNWGKLKESRELYEAFFKQYPEGPAADQQRFYSESAYRYAQMCKRVGDFTNTVQAYRYVLRSKFEEQDLEYQIQTEACETMVQLATKMEAGPAQTALLDEAMKLATKVQWCGNEKIWFWRTVVVVAHIEVIKGNKESALKIIKGNMAGLDAAEELLRKDKELMKLSPMSECRYLMGSLNEETGRDLLEKNSVDAGKKSLKDALVHYFTVIMKYPSSSWAMDARKRIEGIVRLSKSRGWPTPKLPTIDNSKFAAEQLTEARLLFQNNDFQNAAEKYREVLNVYYDRPDMVSAVGELARCYIEVETTEKNYPYYSRAVAGYIADRYCTSTNLYNEAGDTLLLVANAFETRGDRDSAEQVLDAFFDKYNNHKRAVGAVLHRASFALKATNYVAALKYYQMVAEKYTNSARAVDAIGLTAACYARLGDHTNAIVWYSNYVVKLPWSIEQAIAIRQLGDEYQQIGRPVPAINEYNRLAYFLTTRGDKIENSPENQLKKNELLEWALFQKGACYSRLKTPPDRVGYYQSNAISSYVEFLNKFPKSEERAPRVMGSVAMLYYVQGKSKECDDMFQRLKETWPTNEYTRDITAIRVDNLLQLGRTNDAIRVASTMLDKPEAYKPEQFYRIANIMLDASMFEESAKAFTHTRLTTNSNMWQLATLGLGRSLFGMGKHEDAIKPVEELLARNRRSAYTLEANLLLSRCYAEAGKKEGDPEKRKAWFNKSIVAMNKVRKLIGNDKVALFEAELELAAIQLLKEDKSGAAATYLRVFMFGDSADPRQRTLMETAFELGTPILKDLEKYDDVRENCETYSKQFPTGRAIGRAKDWLAWANARMAAAQQPK